MELRTQTREDIEKRTGGAETGVFVRAKRTETDRWDSVDIVELDSDSLLTFLRSRNGDNPWAEDVVGILLGHGHLHDYSDSKD